MFLTHLVTPAHPNLAGARRPDLCRRVSCHASEDVIRPERWALFRTRPATGLDTDILDACAPDSGYDVDHWSVSRPHQGLRRSRGWSDAFMFSAGGRAIQRCFATSVASAHPLTAQRYHDGGPPVIRVAT